MDNLTNMARKDYKRLQKFTKQSVQASKKLINEAYSKSNEKPAITYKSVTREEGEYPKTITNWLDQRCSTNNYSGRNYDKKDAHIIKSDSNFDCVKSVPLNRQNTRQPNVEANYLSSKKVARRLFSENIHKNYNLETVRSMKMDFERSNIRRNFNPSMTSKDITWLQKSGFNSPATRGEPNIKGLRINQLKKI